MKQLRLPVMLFLALCVGASVNAQTSTGKNALTYKYVGSDYSIPKSVANWYDYSQWSNWTHGAEIGYFRYLNKSFNLGLPLRLGVAARGVNQTSFASLDAKLLYKLNNGYLLKEEACIAPFLFAGAGGKIHDFFTNPVYGDFEVPAGVGINFRLSPEFYLQAQSEYRYSVVQKTNNLAHSAGLLWQWGGEPDQDKDGIADVDDACPTVFGLKAFKGCPDTDGDGIEDAKDNCVDVAGTVEMNGCPDKDGDKIADKDDDCVDVPGLAQFRGCPDKDSDGVADKNDNCPDVAGLTQFGGCPDTDGDGIMDKEDNCPKEKGVASYKGCPIPDTDKDGITDDKDKCIDVAGIAQFNGCPDTDGDGVADADDKCPKEKGIKENAGCPIVDTDGDGLADKDDKCPTEKGPTNLGGCPDKDGDGVADKDDACPSTPGIVALKGCPEVKAKDAAIIQKAMNIQFETASAIIKKESYTILDELAVMLKDNASYNVMIEGHTDDQGDDARNLKLSEERVKAAFDYLVKKGLAPNRFIYSGYGETRPIADNKTAEGRAKNRRVEFIIK